MRRLSSLATVWRGSWRRWRLPACGSANDTDQCFLHDQRVAPASHRRRPEEDRLLQRSVYVAGAPGFPEAALRGRTGGEDRRCCKGGHRLRRPFLDIRDDVSYGGERGLLSVAFPPDYAHSKRFYVYYTDNDGNIRIDEFHRCERDPGGAGLAAAEVIDIPHPVNSNHNGGQLQFHGDLLYFGTGDGGSGGDPPNNAQNKDVLLGKLLRIDPRPTGGKPYSVPAATLVGKPGRDGIYSYGLRNPFRFSFDPPKGIRGSRSATSARTSSRSSTTPRSSAASGANFGWDAFEGFAEYTDENSGTPDPGNTVKPIFAYSHSRGGSCSIIGGYVVREPPPEESARPLPLRRPLRGTAADPRPPPEARLRRPQAGPPRRQSQLLRRRRPAPPLRGLPRRPRLPPGPPLSHRKFPFRAKPVAIFCLHLPSCRRW